jgi:hypothetical protein
MDFSKLLPTLAAIAPSIASALGGPLAGMGVSALEDALGVAPADGAGLTKAVLGMTPEIAAAVRAKDQEFNAKMKQMDIDLAKLQSDAQAARDAVEVQDRDSARVRDTALAAAGRSNLRADILAYAAIGGLIGLIWVLLVHTIPEGPTRDMLLILSGALVAIVKDVYGFEFGSSRGSVEKSQQLTNLIATKAPDAT